MFDWVLNAFLMNMNICKQNIQNIERNKAMRLSNVATWVFNLSLPHKIQQSLNSGSAEVQTLLTACLRFVIMVISDNDPG